MKKIFLVILSCFIVFSLMGCGDSDTSSSSNLSSGQSITLSDDTPTCSSKENVDKMIDFVQNKNSAGEQGMLDRGEAKILPKGTKVNIIKVGTVVEMEDENGTKYFAPEEAVK